jgi:hypothetical protein
MPEIYQLWGFWLLTKTVGGRVCQAFFTTHTGLLQQYVLDRIIILIGSQSNQFVRASLGNGRVPESGHTEVVGGERFIALSETGPRYVCAF